MTAFFFFRDSMKIINALETVNRANDRAIKLSDERGCFEHD